MADQKALDGVTKTADPDINTRHNDQVASVTRNQSRFRLLDLPPELVVSILELAVVTSNPGRPIAVTEVKQDNKPHAAAQPAMTRTCRLLRHEGLKLFYSRNIFAGESAPEGAAQFWSWVDCIGRHNSRMIKSAWMLWVGFFNQLVDSEKAWLDHFVIEMEWQRGKGSWQEAVADEALVRIRSGKVLFAVGDLGRVGQEYSKEHEFQTLHYQLSFGDHLKEPEKWCPIAKVRELDLGAGAGRDFWISATEGDLI